MRVGVVVIGRNEAGRLGACLESVLHAACPTVYVDSASYDASLEIARRLGVDSIRLEPPLSAARARNAGFERLLDRHPGVAFVQFLDGDCTLLPGWIDAAVAALEEEPRRAAVIGELLERNAQASVYNRLCQLEWRSAAGDLSDFGGLGGIALMRAAVFRSLGGFMPQVIAGEDSELGVRMALAGYKVTKLARPMATHDAGMTSFRQWWRRAVRAGHAIGQRSHLHGRSALHDCVRERNSTLFWGLGLPLAILASAFAVGAASLVLLAGYAALAIRVWRHRRRQDDAADAALYAAFLLIAKFANAVGLLKFAFNQRARRYEIIEYK